MGRWGISPSTCACSYCNHSHGMFLLKSMQWSVFDEEKSKKTTQRDLLQFSPPCLFHMPPCSMCFVPVMNEVNDFQFIRFLHGWEEEGGGKWIGGVWTSTSLVKHEESARSEGQRYMAPPGDMIGEIDPLIGPRPQAETVLINSLIRRSQQGAESVLPTGVDHTDGLQIGRCWCDDLWTRTCWRTAGVSDSSARISRAAQRDACWLSLCQLTNEGRDHFSF